MSRYLTHKTSTAGRAQTLARRTARSTKTGAVRISRTGRPQAAR